MTKTAGIIGGTGRMGRLFRPVFERAGYEVLVSGRSTDLTARELAERSDLVIVSVPIRETVRVIDEIAPVMNRDQLLCDFTSLKVRPVEAMLRSEANVIGLHPMFGPTVKSLRQQTIIVCPARADETQLQPLLSLFRAEGALCTITTAEQHDRMMAVVQGLTHYMTLCMADTVQRLGIDPEKTADFTSPVYQIEISVMGRLLSQDAGLYADILQMNPYVPEVLDACHASAGELAAIVRSQDPELFGAFFAKNRRHFGASCEEGMKVTDMLIESLVNR